MFCSKCGTQVADAAAFCPSCGQSLGQPAGSEASAPRGIPLAPGGFAPRVTIDPSLPATPDAMPTTPYAGVARAGTVVYAGFWLRFIAFILDAVIVGIPTSIVFLLILGASRFSHSIFTNPPETPSALIALLGAGVILRIVIFSVFITWLYYALLESSAWQATVGKKLLGVYITDLGGNRVSFGRASGRYFGMVLFRLPPVIGPLLIFPIDCICAGFTEKKQALHDMMAGCFVLRKT